MIGALELNKFEDFVISTIFRRSENLSITEPGGVIVEEKTYSGAGAFIHLRFENSLGIQNNEKVGLDIPFWVGKDTKTHIGAFLEKRGQSKFELEIFVHGYDDYPKNPDSFGVE